MNNTYFQQQFSSEESDLSRDWLASQYGPRMVFGRNFEHLDESRWGDHQFAVSEVTMLGNFDT